MSVDIGLIKMMLKMTPEERLDYNTRTIKTVLELRHGVKKASSAGANLETLIELKKESTRPEDQHRLSILEKTLEQIRQDKE